MEPTERPKLKKIDNAVWMMEQHDTMKVPAYIFANDNLIGKMQSDRTLLQLKNVASLEGIVKSAMVMPDGHEGYGFPIGGVAAFDAETGVVSPGGIGYDINCLPGDAIILDEFGTRRAIQSFSSSATDVLENDGITQLVGLRNVRLLSMSNTTISSSPASYFMRRKESVGIYKILTASGHELRATGDHPLLTDKGMVLAKDITPDSNLAVVFFEGTEFENNGSSIIFDGSSLSDERKHELVSRGLLPLTYDHPALPRLARLLGYNLGDGSIHVTGGRICVSAFGKEEDLQRIKEDIELLGFSANIYKRKRKSRIKTQYGIKEFDSSSAELHVPSRAFADLLSALGAPVGKKTNPAFVVPKWITESKKWIKRLFLAAFFGAEMSSPQVLSKTAFYMAVVGQNKNKNSVESGRFFLLQIAEMLKEFGIETRDVSVRREFVNKEGETYRLRLMIAGEDNLLKLWRTIGFEYNKKRKTLSEIACAYILAKRRLQNKRVEIASKVVEYKKKGFKLKELQEMFVSEISNARFIERAYYESCTPRINLTFESFEDFKKNKIFELESYGAILEQVISVSFESFNDYVYDFTVDNTHNFIANGCVVSNCGVRLLKTSLTEADVRPKIKEICDKLFINVPSGVGSEGRIRISHDELDDAVIRGVGWAIEKGYGTEEDKQHTEEYGCIPDANPKVVTPTAKKRGKSQFGTLGAGNHFLEIQVVDKILNPVAAKAFGLHEGQITVMIHCGSRGYGHQICTDNLGSMLGLAQKMNLWLPDKELVYAPLNTPEAKNYMDGMRCAVNFAFTNRHIIAHWTRETFSQVFGKSVGDNMPLLYDVAHNIAKFEEHNVDGKRRKLIVHRKGATRAFPAGREELPPVYRSIGQPVLIPGSMGTSSYILVGNQKGLDVSWGTTCHGAGRAMSRGDAIRKFNGANLSKELWNNKNIYIRATEPKVVAEEAPDAYKNVDDVVESVASAGISDIVAKLRPIGVVKG